MVDMRYDAAYGSLTARMPDPPKAIEGIIDEYQEFLASIFTREYNNGYSAIDPIGTVPVYSPKLSQEEMDYSERLMRKLNSMPEWKDYVKQCKQWAVLM